jgi:hypothetical protein
MAKGGTGEKFALLLGHGFNPSLRSLLV